MGLLGTFGILDMGAEGCGDERTVDRERQGEIRIDAGSEGDLDEEG